MLAGSDCDEVIPALDEGAVPVVPNCEAILDYRKADYYRLPAEGHKPKQLQLDPVCPRRPRRWEGGWINRRELHERVCHEAEKSGRLYLLDRFLEAARQRRGYLEEHGMWDGDSRGA